MKRLVLIVVLLVGSLGCTFYTTPHRPVPPHRSYYHYYYKYRVYPRTRSWHYYHHRYYRHGTPLWMQGLL